jgi:hypothetical protein
MGFRCPTQRSGAQSKPPWGQSLPRSFLHRLTHNTMERKIRRGPAVDAFVDCDGGHCRSSRQHPQGEHRRTSSSTTMVAAVGAPSSTPRGPPSTSSSTTMVAAAGAPGSTPRGPAIDVWLKTWYLSPAFLLRDTYQGATMANTTTADRSKFRRKIFLEKG